MENPLRGLPEAIIILDVNNQIIGLNPAGEQFLKMKRTDLIGKSVDVVFHRLSLTTHGNGLMADGRKDVNFSRKDGQVFDAELTISTINSLDGNHMGKVVVIRDNAQTQSTEMRTKKDESKGEQSLMLRALQETTFDLHSSLDLDIVLRNIVERACKLLGTTHGYLDILRESGELKPVVGIGALNESLKHKVVKGEGVAGIVWETGQPLVIAEYDEWTERISEFQHGLIRAILGMPLLLKGQVVGVIGVARGKESTANFSDDDVFVLKRFADLAVVALQNARLFEKAQAEIEFRRKTEIQLRNANQLLQFQIERVELLQEQLQEQAVRDPLTQLYNRRYLQESLEMEFKHPERSNLPTAILMLDSDHLKDINDKYGHKAGDDFLVYISDVIQKSVRTGDIACRYGGDEFVVVLGNVTEEVALERAEKLRETISSHHILHRNKEVKISVSIGIAMFPAHGTVAEQLLQRADQALYVAKRMGKNRVLVYRENQK